MPIKIQTKSGGVLPDTGFRLERVEPRNQGEGPRLEIYIYDVIGEGWFDVGITAASMIDQIKDAGDVTAIDVYIASHGGSLFEGLAIYNLLSRISVPVTTYVDGFAFSAASLVFQAGDTRIMPENSIQMIHDPLGAAMGTAEDLRDLAGQLDDAKSVLVSTYAARSKLGKRAIAAAMSDETFYNAQEALEAGLTDKVTSAAPDKIAAISRNAIDWSALNCPDETRRILIDSTPPNGVPDVPDPERTPPETPATQETDDMADNQQPVPATLAELESACPAMDDTFYVEAQRKQMTLEQAQTFHAETLRLQREARDAELAEANEKIAAQDAELAKIKAQKSDAGKPVGTGAAADDAPFDGDPIAVWQERITAGRNANRSDRETIGDIARNESGLHAAYIAATNARHGRPYGGDAYQTQKMVADAMAGR